MSNSTINDNVISGGTGFTETNGIYNYNSGTTVNNNIVASGNGDSANGIVNYNCSGMNTPNIDNNEITGGTGSSNSRGIFNYSSYAIITDNNIIGGNDAIQSFGIYNYTSLPIITDNIIDGGIGTLAIKTTGIYNGIVSDCSISANTISGGSGQSTSTGIQNSQSSPMIANNIIFGGDSLNAIGVRNESMAKPYILNNTINAGSKANAIGIFIISAAAPYIRNNNIFAELDYTHGTCGIYEYNADADPSEVKNNNFFNLYFYYDHDSGGYKNAISNTVTNPPSGALALNAASGSVSGNITNNLISGNYFVDYANKDYRLKTTTPAAVKTGALDQSSETNFPKNELDQPIDKDGIVRTVGWSIGAYEQNN
jgi:hypothetical protein